MSLPPSSDKEFWGENEVNVFDKPTPQPKKEHTLVWKGPFAVCISCDYEHTVKADILKQDIVDGKLVNRKDNVIE